MEQPPRNAFLLARVATLCGIATRLLGVDGAAVAAAMSSTARDLVHATDDVAHRIDDLQFAVGEGPCLDAYVARSPQLCPHLDAAGPRHRWPAFSAGVRELGVHAVFAFPLPDWGSPIGVLELYRRRPGALSGKQLGHAADCAQAIGTAILSSLPPAGSPAELVTRAEAALVAPADNPFSRWKVHVASGIIAVELDVHPDEALVRLRAHAYAHGRTVRSAADDVVAGRLTFEPPDGG